MKPSVTPIGDSMNLQDEETPIDQRIVEELVSLTPEWWRRVSLEVTNTTGDDLFTQAHVIRSPEGHRDYVDPSDALFDATYQLAELFRRYGHLWKKVRYEVQVDEEGLDYDVEFEY